MISAVSLALFLVFAIQAPQSPGTAAALAEINKGNLFEGVRQLKEIVRADPSAAPAYFYLSSLYTRTGRYETAYRYLSTAMKANPGQGAYYHQLGVIRRFEGCRPEALAAFQQALKAGMGKDAATVWREVGEVQLDLLSWKQANDAFSNAVQIDPNDARSHLALGRFYVDRNEPDKAILELRSALKADPAQDGAYAMLGRAYRALGDLPQAVKVLREGIARNPSDQDSRYVLGQVLLVLGQAEEGRHEMEAYRAVQEQMSQTNNLFEAGIQRAQAGDLEHAEQLFRDTLGIAPRYAPALHLLGVVLLNRGNSQRGLEMLQQAAMYNPLNPDIYFQMGTAYFRSGRISEALVSTERALVLDDEDPRFHALLGDIYSKMNRAADARTSRERAARSRNRLRAEPTDPYASEMRHGDDAATVKEICGQEH